MPFLSDFFSGLAGIQWQYLALNLALCLMVSSLGFKRVQYFVSLGYGFSIAVQATVVLLLYWNTSPGWALIQSTLLLAYGLRLGVFLALREKSSSYQTQQVKTDERGADTSALAKGVIWLGVSVLYVVMVLPALLTLSAQAAGQTLQSIPFGVALMVLGLGLEASADFQKSRFKQHSPTQFCNVGLFRIVRFPNYLGEMVFWFGLWISAMSAYRSTLGWVLGSLGFACIELVMLGSSRRLERKQTNQYGTDAAYLAYASQTPILFPFLPIYSLQKRKDLVG